MEVMKQWPQENRAIDRDSFDRVLHSIVDRCGGHHPDDEMLIILEEKRIQFNFLPANTADVAQPLDAIIT